MKYALSALFLVLAAALWIHTKGAAEDAALIRAFTEAVDKQEMVFIDSSNRGASMDGAILSLHFFPDAKIQIYTWGNGFSNYTGSYTVTENNEMTLSFKTQSWPRLRLSAKGDSFVIERLDGLTSLTKSFVHTDENGVRRIVDDGDIYPEARPFIFPLTQRASAPR